MQFFPRLFLQSWRWTLSTFRVWVVRAGRKGTRGLQQSSRMRCCWGSSAERDPGNCGTSRKTFWRARSLLYHDDTLMPQQSHSYIYLATLPCMGTRARSQERSWAHHQTAQMLITVVIKKKITKNKKEIKVKKNKSWHTYFLESKWTSYWDTIGKGHRQCS